MLRKMIDMVEERASVEEDDGYDRGERECRGR